MAEQNPRKDPPGSLPSHDKKGQIAVGGQRTVLFSATALGLLRKDLAEELGKDRARFFWKRFGYSGGFTDALSLRNRLTALNLHERIEHCFQILSENGMINLVPVHCPAELAEQASALNIVLNGFHSLEALEHQTAFSSIDGPACWITQGYLSGILSGIVGRKILAVEKACAALGDPHCIFEVDFEQQMPAEIQDQLWHVRPNFRADLFDDLHETIKQQQQSLLEKQQEIHNLQQQLSEKELAEFPGIRGESEALRKALAVVRLAAPVDSTVLLLGESGTGKELLAHAIHYNSLRAEKPFIAVNCSALPEQLQESEFFGYRKGAFTGANEDRAGLFESAGGGTLFLDEIGDLTLSAQTKILRTLQEGEIRRIGEAKTRSVDVRIIAATNKDLEKMIQEKSFRADLYYRLNVISINLPPLRDRGGDVLLLANDFVSRFIEKFSRPEVHGISSEAQRALMRYSWPGNVRELRHALERAVILADGPEITLQHLPDKVVSLYQAPAKPQEPSPSLPAKSGNELSGKLTGIKDDSERLRMALNLVKGNREKAAALLGISRTTLWRRMQDMKGEGGRSD